MEETQEKRTWWKSKEVLTILGIILLLLLVYLLDLGGARSLFGIEFNWLKEIPKNEVINTP
jgi:hypothetical protein